MCLCVQKQQATEPDNSVTVMWDFITGLPAEATSTSVVYALYEGAVARSPVRRTAVADAVAGKCVMAQQRIFPPVRGPTLCVSVSCEFTERAHVCCFLVCER